MQSCLFSGWVPFRWVVGTPKGPGLLPGVPEPPVFLAWWVLGSPGLGAFLHLSSRGSSMGLEAFWKGVPGVQDSGGPGKDAWSLVSTPEGHLDTAAMACCLAFVQKFSCHKLSASRQAHVLLRALHHESSPPRWGPGPQDTRQLTWPHLHRAAWGQVGRGRSGSHLWGVSQVLGWSRFSPKKWPCCDPRCTRSEAVTHAGLAPVSG